VSLKNTFRRASQLFLIKMVMVASVLVCLFAIPNSWANRFELIDEQLSPSSQQRRLFYLDRVSQQVFVKEYDSPPAGGFRRASSPKEVLTEEFSSERNDGGSGQLVSFHSYSLNTAEGQGLFRQSLAEFHPEQRAEEKHNSVINSLRTGSSRYKLLQVAEANQKQVGVYHNAETGEFILQAIENLNGNKHSFALTGGAINDLSLDESKQKTLLFKSFNADTLHQFDQASAEINQELLRQGFQLPADPFSQARSELRASQENFERIHVGIKSNVSDEIYEESLYNPILNQILRRTFRYNDDGSQEVIEEEIIDLNHDIGFARAEEIYNSEKGRAEAFAFLLQQGVDCPEALTLVMPESNEQAQALVGQVDLVLEQLWQEQIEAGLPDSITMAPNNAFVLELSLFGEKHSLIGEMNASAQMVDLNFGNVDKARQRKIRIRHVLGDSGAKQFLVEAFNEFSGEWEAQAIVEGETYLDTEGVRRGRLAAHIRGEQSAGAVSFDDFEKSVYNLKYREGGILFDADPRIRLNGQRANPFSGMTFRREGDGGLMNIAFQLFFSRKGKREKVRETILEEATRTFNAPEYEGLLSAREIARVAESVTAVTEQRTDGFDRSKNEVEAIATTESYSQFGELLLKTFISDFLKEETEGNVKQMADQVMVGFRQCLDAAARAKSASNANQCMEVFTKEAPVGVGELVLKKKLEGAGLGDFKDFAAQKYRSCIQENYDGTNADILKEDGMDRVKDCIYRSIVLSLNVGAEAVVNEKVGVMSQEMGLPLSFSAQKVEQSMVEVRRCLEDEGLGNFGAGSPRFNAQRLRSMPTDLFEQSLMFCTNSLVRDVTKEVGGIALAANLSGIEGLDSEAKARVSQATLAPSLERCMDILGSEVQSARELYRRRRSELASQNTKEENLDVGVLVPSFDTEECTRVLTNLATGHAAKESIDTLIGLEKSTQAQQADSFNPLACFESLHRENLANIPSWIRQNSGKPEEEVTRLKEARDRDVETKSAACLAEAISWASYYAAQEIIETTLGENPEYAKIELNSSLKARIGSKVRQCFERELSQINTVDRILEEQEKLKDICAADMLKDRMIQKDLFSPYIKQAMSSVAIGDSLKERLVETLANNLGDRLMTTNTLDEAMAIIDGFKDEAIPIVVGEAVKGKIYEVLSLNLSTPNANADALASEVAGQIFGADGRGDLGVSLREALASGDDAKVEMVIGSIESQAAKAIGPQVIRDKGNELLASGDFSSQEEVEDLVRFGSYILSDCLDATLPAEELGGKYLLDFCIAKTNLEATKYVLDKKVTEQLTTNSLLVSIMDEQRVERLKEALINEELSNQIEAVGEMVDGPEKDAAGSRLILNFKLNATQLIFNDVLEDVVSEKLPTPSSLSAGSPEMIAFNSQQAAVVNSGISTYNTCIDPLKARLARQDNSVTQLDLDECMNKARLNITEEILPKRLGGIVKLIFPDLELVSSLSDKGRDLFKACSEKHSVKSDSEDYGHKLDGCLNQAVIDFVGIVIDELKDSKHGLLGEDSQISWERCQQQIERAGQQLIYEGSTPREVRELSGPELFAELYKAGEAMEPKRSPDTDWIEGEIIKCAASKIAPTALMEFREEFLKRHNDNLDAPTEALIFSLTSALVKAWRTPTSDGSPVQVDFGSLLSSDESEDSGASQETSIPPLLSLLGKNEEVAIDYLSLIAAYDPESIKRDVEEFEEKAVALSASATGPIPVEQFVDVMAEGQMMETLIESIIAKTVRDETMKALNDEGADTSVVWLLSSKEMIGRLFSTEKGRAVISKIKNQYLIPLMKGELEDSAIPESLMNEAKEILIADTGTNGFVETLFGPIAQKGLSDQRAGIETAWWPKRWGAYLIGYNTDVDFVWGDRYDTSRARYHLRLTPSGREAVNFFAEEILRPTLMGGISDRERENATKKVTGFLKEAMNENL
jgi:hypothetical protein